MNVTAAGNRQTRKKKNGTGQMSENDVWSIVSKKAEGNRQQAGVLGETEGKKS